ncbi:MAG: hypothetical protein KGL35_17760 [Bradyrhizobium sp.]|nr:hypothetical protein [Bradyrhizobium sp.]
MGASVPKAGAIAGTDAAGAGAGATDGAAEEVLGADWLRVRDARFGGVYVCNADVLDVMGAGVTLGVLTGLAGGSANGTALEPVEVVSRTIGGRLNVCTCMDPVALVEVTPTAGTGQAVKMALAIEGFPLVEIAR